VDLYVIAHAAPVTGKYRPRLLDATREIIAKLDADHELAGSVRRIAYLTSAVEHGQLTFA
jgi:hypothetical protein